MNRGGDFDRGQFEEDDADLGASDVLIGIAILAAVGGIVIAVFFFADRFGAIFEKFI